MAQRSRVVELIVENGLDRFHCPACGTGLLIPEEGFVESTCPHLRFFLDWVDEMYLAEAKSVAPAARANQEKLLKLWQDYQDDESAYQEEALAKLIEALPGSAVVFRVEEPARGGGHDVSITYWGIDFTD